MSFMEAHRRFVDAYNDEGVSGTSLKRPGWQSFTEQPRRFRRQSMTLFVNRMYIEQVRMSMKTKMEAMVKAGYHCGGFPPFGYDKVVAEDVLGLQKAGKEPPKRLVPNADLAPIVREAFRMYHELASMAPVRAYLNVITSRNWSTTSVKNLLTN